MCLIPFPGATGLMGFRWLTVVGQGELVEYGMSVGGDNFGPELKIRS